MGMTGAATSLPTTCEVLPTTTASRPFGTWLRPDSVVDLGAVGYEEVELIVRGQADVTAEGHTFVTDAPYTTRVLVRRPTNPLHFSGTVHVEPFHQLAEAQLTWRCVHQHIIASGHAWIGVTVNAGDRPGGGAEFLRDTDPGRYSVLQLCRPPDDPLPPPPEGIDVILRALRMSMAHGSAAMAQIGNLLWSGRDDSPMAGHGVTHIFGSGWSGTGMFWQEFIDDRHAAARRPDGGPIFDGYLPFIHREPVTRPDDAVVAVMFSEGEVWGMAAAGVRTSAEDTARFRIYEVPGSTHTSWSAPRAARESESAATQDHDGPHNDRSFHRLAHALFANLDRCVRDGTPMPAAGRITRDPDSPDGIARDEHGNAIGGLRTAWVDVPSARYLPRCRCSEVLGYSPLYGAYQPFSAEMLTELYGNAAGHTRCWNDRVSQMVTEGWLLPADAAALTDAPE
jgi:hypothetical protein